MLTVAELIRELEAHPADAVAEVADVGGTSHIVAVYSRDDDRHEGAPGSVVLEVQRS